MTGIGEYLLIIGCTMAVRTLADMGVKYSKHTKNTVDDVVAEFIKGTIDKITGVVKLKK